MQIKLYGIKIFTFKKIIKKIQKNNKNIKNIDKTTKTEFWLKT